MKGAPAFLTVGDAVAELGSLIPTGIIGSPNNRSQVLVPDLQNPRWALLVQ